jgi:hypothetical protein
MVENEDIVECTLVPSQPHQRVISGFVRALSAGTIVSRPFLGLAL